MEEHPQARFIVETLAKEGFIAYYAGGWVRDFLLKHPSDDIDIATNAPPETVQTLFPHTVPIGIAFGIILVIIDGREYEVATFRQDLDYKDGRRPSRIEFTSAIEDAKRRDFTINGMFYDPLTGKIFDYVEGRLDLEKKIIRAIGNPHERIKEDRLRMIRAARLACRFGFTIEPETHRAICAHAEELFPSVAVERIWQEFTKGHAFGKLGAMLLKLHEFGLLGSIFPTLKKRPLSEIKALLEPAEHYPRQAPVIATLLALFPDCTREEAMQLAVRFKLSKADQQFVSYLIHLQKLNRLPSVDLCEWAHAYADSAADMVFQILAAHTKDPAHFMQPHKARMQKLHPFIERIQRQDPVVKSGDLMQAGVSPGKSMGLLLREAEKISINEGLEDPKVIIQRLKLDK